ncbi:MAG: DUF192 domain-containing protein [Oligoflexia bacterium]|nr:DUF192 domain-containing protein [Oligoflexia bacterium]
MSNSISSLLKFSFLFLAILLSACNSESKNLYLELSNGKKITLDIAATEEAKTKGLSGIKDKDYRNDQGLLFLYNSDGFRRFWMPDTYFDLDIFFLDKDFVVLHIERKVKHHPGRAEPPAIARTPPIFSRHVLELKAASELSQLIKKGDKLKLVGNLNLLQKE